MKETIISLIAFILLQNTSNAQTQNPCDFDELRAYFNAGNPMSAEQHRADINWWQHWLQSHPENAHLSNYVGWQLNGACNRARLIIPVAVTVVHNNGSEKISTLQIDQAINKMNEYFANGQNTGSPAVNTGIQFVLGRVKFVTSATATNHRKIKDAASLAGYMSNTDTFLNIWVVKSIRDTAGNATNLQGFSTYPGQIFSSGMQGIVVRYDFFGDYLLTGAPLDLGARGDLVAHEVAHYLGLLHPYEGACKGTSLASCSSEGDLCCDVPPVSQQNTSCIGVYNTCFESYNGNARDQKQNIMDASQPDCRLWFTADQTKLMYARIGQYRQTLGLPHYMPALLPNVCTLAPKLSGNNINCKGEPFVFKAYYYNNATYTFTLYNSTGYKNTVTTTSNTYTASPTTVGKYSLAVRISNGTITVTDTLKLGLELINCSQSNGNLLGNWAFGQRSGINFYNNQTMADLNPRTYEIPNQIQTPVNSLSVNGSNGKLLFYGAPNGFELFPDGYFASEVDYRIYGKNYKEIEGSPLYAASTATQSAIAIPMPDSASKYYVFYIRDNQPGLNMAVINTAYKGINSKNSPDSAFGIITRKDILIEIPDTVSVYYQREAGYPIAAVPKCNGVDYWLLFHNVRDGRLFVFDVHGNAIDYHSSFSTGNLNFENFITFNPQGSRFFFGTKIYDFNKITGKISNTRTPTVPHLYTTFNCAWAADGHTFYRTEWDTLGSINGNFFIVQYDFEDLTATMGRQILTQTAGERIMQTGPDGKIYIATDKQPYLGVINNPTQMNYKSLNECGYKAVGIELKRGGKGGTSEKGSLPNLINAIKENKSSTLSSFFVYQSNCNKIKVEAGLSCYTTYKWIWGDGTFSVSNRIDSHTYNSNGTYIVKLIVDNGDTMKRTVQMGVPNEDKFISGSDSVCQPADLQEYYTSNKNYYQYNWKILSNKGTISSAAFNRTEISFQSGLDTIKLVLTDKRNGCKDSVNKKVFVAIPVTNNIIDTNQIYCGGIARTNLTGKIATGGNSTITYQWFIKPHSAKSFRAKNGETGINCTAIQNDTSYIYLRMAKSGNCKYESNRIYKYSIKDLNNIVDYNDTFDCIDILGPTDSIPFNITFKWLHSTNNKTWTVLSGQTRKTLSRKRKKVIIGTGIDYYRRIATYMNCTDTSNIFIHKPWSFILNNSAKNIRTCNTSPVNLNVDIQFNKSLNLLYYWYKYTNTGYQLYRIVTYNNFAQQAQQFNNGDVMTCFVVDPVCGDSVFGAEYSIDKQATKAFYATTGEYKIKTGGTTAMIRGNYQSPGIYKTLFWEFSTDNGNTWSKVPSSELLDTLKIPNVDYSYEGYLYRKVLYNACPPDTVYYERSKNLTLRVIDSSTFYWIRDSDRDTSKEPNLIDLNHYTASYDLWARQAWNYGMPVNGWGDLTPVKSDTNNYIHTIIRNAGNKLLQNGKLHLYWTVASLNEDWPVAWNGQKRFYNVDSGKYFPIGGKINLNPIDLNYLGSKLQNKGDSAWVTYEWKKNTDTIPKPGWYYHKVNNIKYYSNAIGMCMLARITTKDNSPYGMNFTEKENNDPDQNTGNLGYNVVYNRKIVSTNYYLDYVRPPFSAYKPSILIMGVPKDSKDTVKSQRDVEIAIGVDNDQFFNDCEILVTLDDQLWSYYQTSGNQGTGITLGSNPNEIIINSNNAHIGKFAVPVNYQGTIGLIFRYKSSSGTGVNNMNYLFTIDEFIEDTIHTGAMHYIVEGPNGSSAGGGGEHGGGDAPAPLKTTTAEPEPTKEVFTVKPNPFNQYLEVEYKTTAGAQVRIEMFDANGKLVKIICECRADEKGKVTVKTTTQNLAAGTYFVKLWENGKLQHEKVIKNN